MDVVVVIAEFKQHLEAAGYAAATIDGYRKNLDQFCRYLTEHNISDFRKITHQTIMAYQEVVMEQPIAAESKALRLRPVKRLFEHLVDTHKHGKALYRSPKRARYPYQPSPQSRTLVERI